MERQRSAPPAFELLHWLWVCHQRNPINVFLFEAQDGQAVVYHPASRSRMLVTPEDIPLLHRLGLVRGRTELALTRLGFELCAGLWRGERLSPAARQLLQQWRELRRPSNPDRVTD